MIGVSDPFRDPSLSQHPDQHRSQRPILLAVDQEALCVKSPYVAVRSASGNEGVLLWCSQEREHG